MTLAVREATAHPVAAQYPHCAINSTPTSSSHIGTTLYKTHVVGQEESGCLDNLIVNHEYVLLMLHTRSSSRFLTC